MKPWEILFRMDRAGRNEGGAQDHDGTGDEDFDDSADEALVREGEGELEAEGDETESEEEPEGEEEEEQSEEDQEESEELEGDEEPEEKPAAGFKFKDPKTGNFDWKKMNQVLGGSDLEKSFKESQATITRFSQENKTLKEQVAEYPKLQDRAKIANYFDHLVENNPEVRAAVVKALNGEQSPASNQIDPTGFELPPGVHPEDPIVPVLRQMHQTNQTIMNRLQMEDRQRQQQEREGKFLQGLKDARQRFVDLTGKEPTEDQLRLVAKEMQGTGLLNGAKFVPDLFVDEIREAATSKFMATRKEKKNLPRTGAAGRRPTGTQKRISKEQAFEEEWAAHMNSDE